MGDQILSSLTNFAVTLVAARTLSVDDFGAFALVFAGYLLALGLSRAIATDALSVRFSSVPAAEWREATSRAAGAAIWVSTVLATLAIGSGVALSGSLRAGFWILALFLPGLLMQDFWRFAFFAAGRPVRAAANDLVWAAVLAVAFAVLILNDMYEVGWFVAAWGAAATAAACVGVVQARVIPELNQARRWLSENRALLPSFAGEFVVMNGVSQSVVFGIGAVAGLGAAGAFRGATVVFGPVSVITMSAVAIAVPEGARLRARRPHLLHRAMVTMSALIASSALIWGLSVWLLLPDSLGSAMLGETWEGARAVLPAIMAYLVVVGIGAGAVTGLRVIERPWLSLRVRVFLAPATVGTALLGGWADGARGAVFAMVIPMGIAAVVWWILFRTAIGAEAREPAATKNAAATQHPSQKGRTQSCIAESTRSSTKPRGQAS